MSHYTHPELVQQFRSSIGGDPKVGPSDAVAAIQTLLQFIKDNKGTKMWVSYPG